MQEDTLDIDCEHIKHLCDGILDVNIFKPTDTYLNATASPFDEFSYEKVYLTKDKRFIPIYTFHLVSFEVAEHTFQLSKMGISCYPCISSFIGFLNSLTFCTL